MRVHNHTSSETLLEQASMCASNATPGAIPNNPGSYYKKRTEKVNAAEVLEELFNNNVDFNTPNSKFKNFYTYLKMHPELWKTYDPRFPKSYAPIAKIRFGRSKKYSYGMEVDYYILRHKQMGGNMNFCIIAKQSYLVFSWSKWLDPFAHMFSGVYTNHKSRVSFFNAKFREEDGRYSVQQVSAVEDYDSYMSIKAA